MSFENCLPHIFAEEGGYVNHPRDPGGATNLGITRRTLSAYRGRNVSILDMKRLTHKEAGEIYRKNYWNKINGDQIDAICPAIAFVLFDCAVNRGVGRATRLLQKCLGVRVDGVIGNKTLDALQKHPNHLKLLSAILARRMYNYANLKSLFKTFGLGWSRRLMRTALGAGFIYFNDMQKEQS